MCVNKVLEMERLLDYFMESDDEIIKKALKAKSKVNMEKFNETYLLLKDMHDENKKDQYKGVKAKTKGEVLESLIKILILDNAFFEIFDNVTNDTNEYDIITKLSNKGKVLYENIPEQLRSLAICECKNYTTTIGVTWIGKLYSLLETSNIKIGIIFSYEPITGMAGGDGWEDASGLIRKIFLKRDIYIINININDYDLIYAGEKSILEIIEERCEELIFISNISDSKKTHPSEIKITDIRDKIDLEIKEYKKKGRKNNV